MAKALHKTKTSRKAAKPKRTPAGASRTSARTRGTGGIRTYRAARAFLDEHTNFENMLRVGYTPTNFNLARMTRILAALDNPHKAFKSIHVAGTKGKGSTCHMLAATLHANGFKTGLYTSPHLIDLRERIVVNRDWVSESQFTQLMAKLESVVRRLKETPTFFELMTAAAFLHFAEQQVDYAIIETGLGGRLDSTNVLKPEAVGIVNISFDHMAQLGRTLEAIAEEKAGIFKPGVPAISAPQTPAVKRVLRAAAKKVGCELRILGDEIEYSYRFENSRGSGPINRVCMSTRSSRFDHVSVPLLGEHQANNCGVALGIIDCLREKGLKLGEQAAIDGLANVSIRGRLELIRENPPTVVDGAHNAASIAALMRAIGQNISYDSMVVIFACSSDKDIDGMLRELQLGADKVIFTSTGNHRSADPKELHARFCEKSQKMAMVEPDLHNAFRVATHCVGRDDLICLTGSMYLAGKAIAELSAMPEHPVAVAAAR